jgi:hypothetical protein
LQQNHGVPRVRRWHVLACVALYCAAEYFYPSL